MSQQATGGDRALLAWLGLGAALALLNIATVVLVDVPPDRMYRYSTTVLASLQFGLMLAVVLLIARGDGMREVLALRAPASWIRAAAISVVVFVGTLVLLAMPFLQTGQAAQAWDPNRAVPYAVNALLFAIVAPVVEELMFRGLGFTLLARFGHGAAIVLTAVLFGVSHGVAPVVIASTAFGLGLGYMRSRTGSVYPGIVLHIAVNALTVSAGVLGS